MAQKKPSKPSKPKDKGQFEDQFKFLAVRGSSKKPKK